MFPQKLKDLLEGVGYKCLQGDDQVLVNDVVYDSRRVRPVSYTHLIKLRMN